LTVLSCTYSAAAFRVKRPTMLNRTAVVIFIVGVLLAHSLWYQFYNTTLHHPSQKGGANVADRQTATRESINATPSSTPSTDRCAICLFGLPRAFASLVLPSLVENVLQPNAKHGCDYFVHYYNVTHEASGRSGTGGSIRPDDILQLAEAVDRVAAAAAAADSRQGSPFGRRPVVTRFVAETAGDFWRRRGALVDKVRTANDTKGRFLYFPWKDTTYVHPTTTDNILKMWHSIQESWDLMQSHAHEVGIEYTRVAVLRSDVFFLTPIDVWELPKGQRDFNNSAVVIPGFGRYPVSDRLVYGPARAVRLWAAERFERMEAHVDWMLQHSPGWGLHSENFVKRALLEPLQELGFRVVEHPTMCFFRARADESIWTSDCSRNALKSVSSSSAGLLETTIVERVETILRRTCQGFTKGPSRTSLSCARGGGGPGNGT
jgi:hypothetical protein